ncbi:MAG: hypothetical protein IJ157_14190 [Clostridia bacterium]|nr:hypothetical protein [Clostridia bacterium]
MLIDFLLRQRCTVLPWLGMEDGRDVYGEAQDRACRLQERRRLENGPGGDGVSDVAEANALMFCTGDAIAERSRVECEGKRYIVLACRKVHGFGQEHLEVTLQ